MRKLVIAAIGVLLLAGCERAGTPVAFADKSLGDDNMRIWSDPSTGCRYYIYDHSAGNASTGGIAIRFNADGRPDCPEAK